MSDNGKSAAFPVPKIHSGIGLTKREYAAILLRVPDSGADWLDEMILRSHKIGRSATLVATGLPMETGVIN